jgi:hypothetical protein
MPKFTVTKKVVLLIALFVLAGVADAVSTAYLSGVSEKVIVEEAYVSLDGCHGVNGVGAVQFGVEQHSLYFPFLSTLVLLPAALFCLWINGGGKLGGCFAVGLCCVAWTGALNNLGVLCAIIIN